MAQHKWHKEIKAWADGAEIEMWYGDRWEQVHHIPEWNMEAEFRIKPQPKEPNIECNCYGDGNVYRGTRSSDSTIKTYTYPQDWLNKNPITQPKEPKYLYVYADLEWDEHSYKLCRREGNFGQYIGKIKLEDEE